MSLAPDIFSMPVIGLFLGLAALLLSILFITKIVDFVSLFRGKMDVVEIGFTLTRFIILMVPLFHILINVFRGLIPNAVDLIINMFSALFVWGLVKIIYDLLREVVLK